MYIMGPFHSTKTSGLNFWQLPVANGTAFSKISKPDENLARYTQIFENAFSRKFPFHSTLLPEFPEFSVEWFAFRKSTVSRISENFSGNFCTIAAVSKFSKVLVEWKAPRPCKMVTCFVCLTPVRPLLSSMAVLYHVNDYPWRAYSEPSKPGVLKKWSGFNTNSEFKLVKSERFYPES